MGVEDCVAQSEANHELAQEFILQESPQWFIYDKDRYKEDQDLVALIMFRLES